MFGCKWLKGIQMPVVLTVGMVVIYSLVIYNIDSIGHSVVFIDILNESHSNFSARDEKEVELCIRDMNAPSFHPSMVSLWVTDSFERKDMERDVLTKLLVNLTKSRDGVLNQAQLIKG